MDSIRATCEGKGNEIVFADALQNEKHSGGVTRIGNKVRPRGRDRKGLAWRQSHVFLGVLQKDADRSGHHIESVVDVVVIVPRHLLRGTDLQLHDAKTRTHGVMSAATPLQEYFREAASWDADRLAQARRGTRNAWRVAAAAWTCAVASSVALMLMTPVPPTPGM